MISTVTSRLRKYLDLQQRRGLSTPRILATLPTNLLAYVRRRRGPGSQIQGYERFDLPLLASYSRSGTNWIRYAVEWIGQGPTPGNVRLYFTSDYLIDRAHQAGPVMDKYGKVILVLRDYRECLLRQLEGEWSADPDVHRFLDNNPAYQQPSWYIDNLAAFDAHPGEKLLVYYEDLVQSPETAIPQVAQFLGLDQTRIDAFIADLETHRSESVDAYRSVGHQSVTAGADVGHHAKSNLDAEQIREFDDYYRSRHPELFERYLTRYAVSA